MDVLAERGLLDAVTNEEELRKVSPRCERRVPGVVCVDQSVVSRWTRQLGIHVVAAPASGLGAMF